MIMMTYSAIPTSHVDARGFHNQVCDGISSTSWADLVSYFLDEAEKRFGPRDDRWFFTGIAFTDRGPNIYHPGGRAYHVGIHLNTSASTDTTRAYFQLSHEVVHLLGPNQTQLNATYLEEGMCTAFQIEMARAVGIMETGDLGTYQEAIDLIRRLEAIDGNAIKKLRERSKDLRQIDAATFVQILPDVPADLATALSRPFPLR
jgi:hypothetical protein